MDDKYQQLREALAERSKMRGLDPESLCGFNGKQVLLADIHSLLDERDALRAAGEKVLAGLNARINQAADSGNPVPVFDGIAALHDALSL